MPNNHTKQYNVFLSHSSSDKVHVERIAERLEDEAELKPFLDKWHLVPGESWQEALEEALDGSETCAVFLGPNGLGSWENEEMRSALDERVKDKSLRIIPVLLPGANPKDRKSLPRFLRRLTWVDFRTGIDEEEAFNRLIAGIQGKKPGRQSYNSKQQNKVQWVLVLSGTIEDMDKARAEAIAAHLRQLSGDMTLTIKKIEQGSVILIIESSEEGLQRIETIRKQGQFSDVLGQEVLELWMIPQGGESQRLKPPITELKPPSVSEKEDDSVRIPPSAYIAPTAGIAPISRGQMREYLLANNDYYRELVTEHRRYDERLKELSGLHYPSEEERVEEAILKRKKLLLKEQMEAIAQKYRASTRSH